jgi:quercetin dioxygenase-like cupin family protein
MNDMSKALRESLLFPNLGGAFEIMHSVFAPGTKCPNPFVRLTEEAGYVMSGYFTLFIDNQRFDLVSGASVWFAQETITWENESADDVLAVWVFGPPMY